MTSGSECEGLSPGVVRELVRISRSVRDHSYSPYSRFRVGAVVLCGDGKMFSGCNVENASYGLTICAERSALCQAVATGSRDLRAVCISLEGSPLPCGACLQCLCEFNPEMLLLLDDVLQPPEAGPEIVSLRMLLPRPFLMTEFRPGVEMSRLDVRS